VGRITCNVSEAELPATGIWIVALALLKVAQHPATLTSSADSSMTITPDEPKDVPAGAVIVIDPPVPLSAPVDEALNVTEYFTPVALGALLLSCTVGVDTPWAATIEYVPEDTGVGSEDVETVICTPATAAEGLATFCSHTVSGSPAADPATGDLIVALLFESDTQHPVMFCPVRASVTTMRVLTNEVPAGAATVIDPPVPFSAPVEDVVNESR